MIPARTRLAENRRGRKSEANIDATEIAVHGRSGQHASHGEDCPSGVECAPSGAETPVARLEARSVDVTRPLHAIGIHQRSERGGHDDCEDTDSNGPSSSSASSAKKAKTKRARRVRAAERKKQACEDDEAYDTQQILAREDGSNMRAPCIANSTPSTSREFGTDVTNRGGVGPTTGCGTGDVSGEAPTSHKGKLGRRDSMDGEPKGRKLGKKPACGRDVCGVMLGAQGDQCTNGEEKRVCSACHRPSQKWTHFSPSSLSRVTECLDDAKKCGVPLPPLVLEGYRPSNDCEDNIYMDIGSDNEEDYSIDREDDMGNVHDWMSKLCGVDPHHWWGIGEGCAAGAIQGWGPEAEGDCEDETDTEADLALDCSRVLDGVL